jgi:hypothetical protein
MLVPWQALRRQRSVAVVADDQRWVKVVAPSVAAPMRRRSRLQQLSTLR